MNREEIINEFEKCYPETFFESIKEELNEFFDVKEKLKNNPDADTKEDYLIAYTKVRQTIKGDYYCHFFSEKEFNHLCELIES